MGTLVLDELLEQEACERLNFNPCLLTNGIEAKRDAVTGQGSWWPDFVDWLRPRSGGERRAPRRLGGRGYPPLVPAPGTYVFDK